MIVPNTTHLWHNHIMEQHTQLLVIPSILTWIAEQIELAPDTARFSITCRACHEVVCRDKRFHMKHVISEVKPYVLRTTLRNEEVVRFTLLNHGCLDPEMKLHMTTCTCECQDFCRGVRSVFLRGTGRAAGSWMERRVYVESSFVRADSLDMAGLLAAIVDLSVIVHNNGNPENQHTKSASLILEGFRIVLRAASDVDVNETACLVRRMRYSRKSGGISGTTAQLLGGTSI